jgi:hypothetical protein
MMITIITMTSGQSVMWLRPIFSCSVLNCPGSRSLHCPSAVSRYDRHIICYGILYQCSVLYVVSRFHIVWLSVDCQFSLSFWWGTSRLGRYWRIFRLLGWTQLTRSWFIYSIVSDPIDLSRYLYLQPQMKIDSWSEQPAQTKLRNGVKVK